MQLVEQYSLMLSTAHISQMQVTTFGLSLFQKYNSCSNDSTRLDDCICLLHHIREQKMVPDLHLSLQQLRLSVFIQIFTSKAFFVLCTYYPIQNCKTWQGMQLVEQYSLIAQVGCYDPAVSLHRLGLKFVFDVHFLHTV